MSHAWLAEDPRRNPKDVELDKRQYVIEVLNAEVQKLQHRNRVLAEYIKQREGDFRRLVGPCRNALCDLYADHAGPCNIPKE